jgi:DNA replication protein DnaC
METQAELPTLGQTVGDLAARYQRTSPPADAPSTPRQTTRSERIWPAGLARPTWAEAEPQAAAKALQGMTNAHWPILLAGDVGAGKSCLAALLWSLFPARSARFVECSALLGYVMAARTSQSKTATMPLAAGGTVDRTESEIMGWVEQASVLVLDDVGLRLLSEAQGEALLRIVNLRYGKPLIVTTNCTAVELPNMVGERINSRLREGTSFRIQSPDRRIAK